MAIGWAIGPLLFGAGFLAAQEAAKPPSFDAASIKPVQPERFSPAPSGSPRSGRIHYASVSLQSLIMEAYELMFAFEVAGPEWLDSRTFELDAVMPAGTTRAQYQSMMQNLLAQRFDLAAHRENREIKGYVLTVAKGGPKMQISAPHPGPDAPDEPIERPARVEQDADGFLMIPLPPDGRPILRTQRGPGRGRVTARRQAMANLVWQFAFLLGAPVSDGTALTGEYDFVLTYSSDGLVSPAMPLPPSNQSASNPSQFPDLFGAVQSQLGLKLEAKKGPVPILVIDRVNKSPTAN